MQFEEKTLKKNYLFHGKILNLRKDEVLLPNDKIEIREMVEHTGGSCILCEKDGKIVLVKQFRYPYGKEIWEIPAGKINAGEDPAKTAIRELEEECGIKANGVEKLFEIYPTPAYTNEIIRIYRAVDIEETSQHLDENEFLSVKWFDKAQLREMIDNGQIKDAKTLIALLRVL